MSKRTRTIALIAVIFGCIVAIIFVGMRGNVIYYYDVTEAVKKAESQGVSRFRLAGAVVKGSIESNGATTTFELTDGTETVAVKHQGDPPELFKNGAPVVAEGHWQKGKLGNVFLSDRIMIKHGNEYSPPEVDQNSDDYVSDGNEDLTQTTTPKT